MKRYDTPYQSFWDKVEKTPGCWLWKASTRHNGNGNFAFNDGGRKCNSGSHRFSYILHYGKIRKGDKIHHLCGNMLCVRPDHLVVTVSSKYSSLESAFWKNVKRGGDDNCWTWIRARDMNGYGTVSFNGVAYRGTHLSWLLHFGETIPEGMLVCHHCDNPPCVNPKHLFLGTHKDNTDDMMKKGRGRFPRAKPIVKTRKRKISGQKLTFEQVEQIRTLYSTGGYSYRQLGKMFGVSYQTIAYIVIGEIWFPPEPTP